MSNRNTIIDVRVLSFLSAMPIGTSSIYECIFKHYWCLKLPYHSLFLCSLLLEKLLYFCKQQAQKSIHIEAEPADVWEFCLIVLYCSIACEAIVLLWFTIYCWLVPATLSPSHSHIHTNQRWVTIIAPSLRHTKNLFHTHTYTNTHLHSAAVCAHIQCLSAREDKNIQYQQLSR